jgi:hypothetical protein
VRFVEVGHSDTDKSSVIHVPSIGLVVAGDVVYNGYHQYLAESGNGGLKAWMTALDTVASLKPTHVVASHKNKDLEDDPKAIQETRRYLEDVERVIASSHDAREFYDAMIRLYPDREAKPPCVAVRRPVGRGGTPQPTPIQPRVPGSDPPHSRQGHRESARGNHQNDVGARARLDRRRRLRERLHEPRSHAARVPPRLRAAPAGPA